MKFLTQPVLLLFSTISCASSSSLHDRATAVPRPNGVPSLSDILAHIKSSPGGQCCAALTYVLGPNIVYPLSAAYTASTASFWSAQEESVAPNCIVKPTSTQDVSSAIFVLSSLSVSTRFSNECKFGIKSGGHRPQPGAASQGGGVTIDLAALRQVQVSADRTTTSIGPGNRWVDIYSQLDARGVAVPGGRVGIVGVGGLVTGGGISFFSGRYGFVCDSIVNYELVLPFGKVVDVNASSYPDLFKALKGGSNNLWSRHPFRYEEF